MQMQDILDRLAAVEQSINDAESTHASVEYDDEDDEAAIECALNSAGDAIAALKLDIEIHCRRAGVAFV